jgi:hypothetical protein
MSSEELEKLAAEGRARRAEATDRERDAKHAEAHARRVEHGEVLLGSVSSYARWGWFVAAFPCGAGLSLACAKALPPSAFIDAEGEQGGLGALLVIGAFFFGFLVTRLLRGWVGRRAVAREAAWVQALPFRLTGYLETLEGRASDGELTLTLTWEDSVPKDLGFVADVFHASGAKVADQGRAHHVTTSWSWDESVSTNHHVVEWLHRVAPTLTALHAKWRLARVEVKASWQ